MDDRTFKITVEVTVTEEGEVYLKNGATAGFMLVEIESALRKYLSLKSNLVKSIFIGLEGGKLKQLEEI